MRISFKKAFDSLLSNKIATMSELINSVIALTGTKYSVDRVEDILYDLIILSPEIYRSFDNFNQLIYTEDISQNRIFYVNLTQEEIVDKKFYLGHRLFPFYKVTEKIDQFSFINEKGEKFNNSKTVLSHEKAYKYIMFQVHDFLENYPITDFGVELDYLDFSKIITSRNVNITLKITITDYQNKIILIEIPSNKEMKEYSLLCNNSDKKILKTLLNTLKKEVSLYFLEDILITIYHLLPIKEIPRFNSFANIYNNQSLFTVNNEFEKTTISYVTLGDENHPGFEAFVSGESSKLNYIFSKMGLSLTEDFVYCLMMDNLLIDGAIDFEWILLDVCEIEYRLDSEKEQEFLINAVKEVADKLIEDIDRFKFPTKVLDALSEYNKATLDILFFLREIDEKLEDKFNFDYQILLPLLEVDHLISDVYESFRKRKKMNKNELNTSKQISSDVKKMVEEFRRRIF